MRLPEIFVRAGDTIVVRGSICERLVSSLRKTTDKFSTTTDASEVDRHNKAGLTLASSPVAAFSDAGSDAGFDEGSNVSLKAWYHKTTSSSVESTRRAYESTKGAQEQNGRPV